MRRHALEVQRLQQACIATTAAANIKQPTSKVREDRGALLSSFPFFLAAMMKQKDHDSKCSCVGAFSIPQLEEDYQRVIQALEEEMGRLRVETEKAEEEKMTVHKLNFELKKEVASQKSQQEKAWKEVEAVRQEAEEKENEAREVRASMDSLTTKLMQQEEDVRLLAAHVDSLRKSKVRRL